MDILTQTIGIIAMVFNVASYQGKTARQILIIRLLSTILFIIHFWLLNEMTGALLNLVASMTCIVFAFKPKKFAESVLWIPFFILCTVACYVLTFTVFGKEPSTFNIIVNLFPVAGMIICIFGFRMAKAARVRILSLFSSPCWLTYNCISGSIGGTITEIIAICSNLFAIFTQDLKLWKKKDKKDDNKEI